VFFFFSLANSFILDLVILKNPFQQTIMNKSTTRQEE